MAEDRIIIIGAGPAGIRAAETVVAAGLRPILIDEERRDGGQIYRRQPDCFKRTSQDLYGSEAAKADAMHDCFEGLRSRIDYRPESLAWNISQGQVHVARDGQSQALAYDKLIIATGATDRVIPVKGWHRAGVFSLGGAQIALKSQACAIGARTVFMGTGPLLYLVAAQYAKAGATVTAVLDTSRYGQRLQALPKLLSRPGMLIKGLQLTRDLKRRGVEIHYGVTPLEIAGDDVDGVQSVSVRLETGEERQFDCDAVGLGYHLRPETQLADLARCAFHFDTVSRQWFPEIDAQCRSSVEGVYLAGDGSRTLGADGAEAAGRLAALAALKDMGIIVSEPEMGRLTKILKTMDAFRNGLATAFPWPHAVAANLSDDTIVCRCEAITAGEIRATCGEIGSGGIGADELNRAKAFSRVGMGRCQGRYCGPAASEILAQRLGVPVEQVGRLRGQAPVKPLSIATVGDAP